MNIYGISYNGIEIKELQNGILHYPEINLILPTCNYNGAYSVARKISIVPFNQTPYRIEGGNILFKNKLIFNKESIKITYLGDEPKNLNGYSFSFAGTNNPFYELRINPKNTGYCPGKCKFCHRAYSYRMKPSFSYYNHQPKEIIKSIISKYDISVFKKISHVSIITELFGNEKTFLDFLIKMRYECNKVGCKPISFGACSSDIRTPKGLKLLNAIVTPKKYSFTLETFSKRSEVMSKYKGFSLKQVKEILINARKAHFDEIKINYVAGIDSFSDFELNLTELKKMNLIDSIGFSILTTFFSDQKDIRHKEAYEVGYYLNMVRLIKKLGIKFYKPECYEMGLPLKLL